MKPFLVLLIAASAIFAGCNNHYYPNNRQYPRSTAYPYPGNAYPYSYPVYPQRGVRSEGVMVIRDGRLRDRSDRVIGTNRNLSRSEAKRLYGSKSERRYANEHGRYNNQYDNRYYK